MRTLLQLSLAILLIPCASGCGPKGKAESKSPKPSEQHVTEKSDKAEVELVGTLHKPKTSKSAHQLEIYPLGNLKTIELLGEQLKAIPEKTPVRVRGVVRSQVVGPAKDDPNPWPIQWGVWLRV